VQQLRGTRRVGAIFAYIFCIQMYEVGKARARYEVKNSACCALRYWLLAACF